MRNQIYQNRQFKIYKTLEGYIVHNSHKPFEQGHTHILNFNTAKYIVYLSVHKVIPKRLNNYLLVSLIRISEDSNYSGLIAKKLIEKGGESFMCGNKSASKKGKKKPSKKKPK